MKNTKYYNVGTAPKSNLKIVERGEMDTLSTHIHDRQYSWFDTITTLMLIIL